MPWVTKIDKYELLGLKRIRGFPVMHVNSVDRKCTYWKKVKAEGMKQLKLGSIESIEYMKRANVSRFSVGYFGDFEVEFFYLIKDRKHIWYAYSDKCDEMFQIDNIHALDYNLIEQLIDEFRERNS